MENLALILISITLLILVIILGFLTLLFSKLINNKSLQDQFPDLNKLDFNSKQLHPEILKRVESLDKKKEFSTDLNCPNHKDKPGEITCAICDHFFCKACSRPFKSFYVCNTHLPILLRNEWSEVLTLESSADKPEKGVKLFELKKDLFQKNSIPTFVETHYKINVDDNRIETYCVLFAQNSDLEKVKAYFFEF